MEVSYSMQQQTKLCLLSLRFDLKGPQDHLRISKRIKESSKELRRKGTDVISLTHSGQKSGNVQHK